MTFLENLSEVLTSKGKEAAEVAKKVAEIANLKGQITGINTEIKKHYFKIGEAYFENYKDSQIECEFEENVQSIRDAKNAIAELEKRLRKLKGTIECQSCGSSIDEECTYCPKCGVKVAADFFHEEEDVGEVKAPSVEETVVEESNMEKNSTE